VGGAARNKIFRQFITDVFQTPTYMIEQAAWAAPLGCAVSCARQVLGVSYGEAWERLVKKEKSSLLYPQTPAKTINHLLERYQNFIENN
jgi:sugar (pentulose or hexulose) kinase